MGVVDRILYTPRHLGQLIKAFQHHLGTCILERVPSAQVLHGGNIGECQVIVHIRHIGIENARHLETPGADLLFKEIGIHPVAHLQMELGCQTAGNEQLACGGRIGKGGQTAGHQMAMEEGGVVVLSHPAEHHPAEGLLCLQHSRFGTEPLYMPHTRNAGESIQQTVVHYDGRCFCLVEGFVVDHLDVPAQANHLATYLLLEAPQHTHAHNHHTHTNGHPHCGNKDGRTRHALHIIVVAEKAFGDEPGEHGL